MFLPVPDPAPDEDLPSDVAFGVWLSNLDPLRVLLDLENRASINERMHLAYLRRRIAETHRPPSRS